LGNSQRYKRNTLKDYPVPQLFLAGRYFPLEPIVSYLREDQCSLGFQQKEATTSNPWTHFLEETTATTTTIHYS
jgi:hypothetical protein